MNIKMAKKGLRQQETRHAYVYICVHKLGLHRLRGRGRGRGRRRGRDGDEEGKKKKGKLSKVTQVERKGSLD